MKFTGSRAIDELISGTPTNLFYGEAGSGKTNLLLTIAENVCRELRPCIYVNTEDVLFYEIVSRRSSKYENVFFANALGYEEFHDYVVKNILYMPFRALFVDSINSLYRLIAHQDSAAAKYGLLVSLVVKRTLDLNAYLFASAQVRASYSSEEEFVASGMSILDYWFEAIFKVDRDESGRFVECVKPVRGIKAYFEITSEGIAWIG